MRKLARNDTTPLFVPDFIAKSVLDIDFSALRKSGVQYIAFDADSTLVHYGSYTLPKKSQEHLRRQLKQFSGVCIASNRINARSLKRIAKVLDAPIVQAGILIRKPRQAYFKKIVDLFDTDPKKIAMIGDKLATDVWGGNSTGFKTVWVEKLGPDSIWDRLFGTRRKETKLMKEFSADN